MAVLSVGGAEADQRGTLCGGKALALQIAAAGKEWTVTNMATPKKKAKAPRTIDYDKFSPMLMSHMYEVARTGEEIVIELLGVPLAKLTPLEGKAGEAANAWVNRPRKAEPGRDRHILQYYGDLDDPDDTDLTPARSRLDEQ